MKKYFFYIFYICFIGISLFAITGCIHLNTNFSTPSFERQKYSLNISYPKSKTTKSNAPNLEVYYPLVSEKYSGQSFVYKTHGNIFLTDAYNIFFGFPGDQIHQIIINYLKATGQFKYVSPEVFPAKTHYALRTYINKLYADYTNRSFPKASIEIHFVLFDLQNQNNILLDKVFQKNILLKEKTSQALVNAWNIGLKQILQELNSDLNKLPLVVEPTTPKEFYIHHPWKKNRLYQKTLDQTSKKLT